MRNSKRAFGRRLHKSLTLPLVGIFLACCGQSGKEETAVTTTKEGHQATRRALSLNHQQVPEQLLTLAAQGQAVAAGNASRPEKNLYGKFFEDRAEFYTIEQPQNKVYHSNVQKLTLYYLDGQLSQTRYLLEQDIVEELLKMYGSFHITGHDAKNQALIRSKQIMVNTPHGMKFNKELDNYQISWQLEKHQIRYRVNTHERTNRYNYVERVKAYKQTFSEIERADS